MLILTVSETLRALCAADFRGRAVNYPAFQVKNFAQRVFRARRYVALMLIAFIGLLSSAGTAQAQVSCPEFASGVTMIANATSKTCSTSASTAAPSVSIYNYVGLGNSLTITPNTGVSSPVMATCTGGGCFIPPSDGTINCDATSQPCAVSYSFLDANGDTISGSFNIPAYFSAGPIVSAHSVSGGVFNLDTTAPTLTFVSIDSDNPTPSFAKVGDTVTLTLVSDENLVAAPTVTIGGQAAAVTGGPANYTASLLLSNSVANGSLPISVTNFADAAGNVGTAVSATTDTSSVTFDSTGPRPESFVRVGPTDELTSADSLVFQVNFSETVFGVDAADFSVTGSTTASVTNVAGLTGSAFRVTISGGDLADFTGTVGLTSASSVSYTDTAGNTGFPFGGMGFVQQYTLAQVPDAPTNLSVDSTINPSPDNIANTQAQFSWTPATEGNGSAISEQGISIYPNPTCTAAPIFTQDSLPASLNAGPLDFALSSYPVGSQVGVTVFAVNGVGRSADSNCASFTIPSSDVTAPTLSGVVMTSNNASPEWAKVGDVITLTFTADEALQTSAVTIAGQTASVSNVGNNYTATITVGSSTPDGQATFNISYSDLAGNAGAAVTNDTLPTLPRVKIITTIPTLTEVTAVASVTMDTTPDVVLSSSAGGDIVMNEDRCALPAPVSRSPGNHTITFDTLADGIYNCTAVLTDSAGNQSLPLTLTPFAIDTSAPVAPTALDMVAASDSGDSDSDNLTNVRQPTFTVTVPADAANVLFFANGAQIGTSVPTSTTVTYMSYTVLDDGNFSITAKSVDAAGNQSGASSGLAITIDGTAPTTSITSTETGPVLAAGFPVAVTFSEPVVSTPTVTPGNGGAGALSTDNNTIFNFRVFPDETGPVTVDVPAGTTADLAGNLNVAAPQFSINADVTNPTILSVLRGFNGVSRIPETTSLDVVSWHVKFSEDIIRPVASDFLVTGTTSPITISEVNADEYEISLADGDIATVNGIVTLSISRGNEIKDVAGNGLGSLRPSGANENSFIMDNDVVAPTAQISQYNPAFVSGPFTLSVTLSEEPDGFTVDDFTVLNGTASNLLPRSASGFEGKMGMAKVRRAVPVATSYFVTITPTNAGEVTVSLPAGSFQDTSGNDNLASNAVSVTFDNTRPTLTITSDAGPSVSGPFVVTLTFSEGVDPRDGFGGSRTVVGNGTVTNITTVSDSVYTLEITPSAAGTVTLDIQEDAAFDIAGNYNIASTQFSVVNDTTLPTVLSVTRATPADAETDADTLVFAVTFSEAVANIDGSDFAFTGTTATSTVTAVNATTYHVTASGGDLADINAEVGLVFSDSQNITDNTGGNTLAATTPSGANETFSVINDTEAPTVLIASPLDGPVSGEFPITVTFSEEVTGFDAADLTVDNGSASNFASTSASEYTATITPTADGVVTIDIAAAAAQDSAGNASLAASQFSITNDGSGPTVLITSTAAVPVSGAFPITVNFSEDVSGFALSHLTVGNGTASDFVVSSASVYTATITPGSDGVVTVDIAENVVQDAASNGNVVAPQFAIDSDGTVPTVSIIVDSLDVTGPFTATFEFSEAVSGVVADTISIENGTLSNFGGSGSSYSGLVTPSTIGDIQLVVASGTGQDAAGNGSLEASLTLNASGGGSAVSVVIASGQDPAEVNAVVGISNPGSEVLDFIAFADQPWLDVTPEAGRIASLGEIDISFAVNDLILELPAGTFTANVIIELDDGLAQSGVGLAKAGRAHSEAATGSTLIASIPVTIELQAQRGDFELIVRTPSGLSNGTSFVLSSDIDSINNQSVAADRVEARFLITDLIDGAYFVEQAALDGYVINDISCAGDTDGGNVINIQAGRIDLDLDALETQVCIITNGRNDDAIRLATSQAIRGFMERRGDRIMSAAPDLSKRFTDRQQTQAGEFAADANDRGGLMTFKSSLSGARNKASQNAVGDNIDLTNPKFVGWDVWTSAEYAKINDDRKGGGIDSEFFVAQFGVDYQIRSNLLIGAILQYDRMSEDNDVITPDVGAVSGAQLDGEGVMVGPYSVWQLDETLIIDAIAIFGSSSNSVNPLGYYEDDFDTDRFLLQTNVTGEFEWGSLRIRPQVGWAHYQDSQNAYTDSLGIDIPSQTVTIGRLRAGPELIWTQRNDEGVDLQLGTSLRAVWNYNSAGVINLNSGAISSGSDPIRIDGDLSASIRFASGLEMGFEVGIDGIGQGDFNARSGRLTINFPFGGSSKNGAALNLSSLPGGDPFALNDCQNEFESAGRSTDCGGAFSFGR